jgi:hypothetical protein
VEINVATSAAESRMLCALIAMIVLRGAIPCSFAGESGSTRSMRTAPSAVSVRTSPMLLQVKV